jgi:hypothetical protein
LAEKRVQRGDLTPLARHIGGAMPAAAARAIEAAVRPTSGVATSRAPSIAGRPPVLPSQDEIVSKAPPL